ncbi:hypothetical protein LTR37_002950 [Vermiconidia calcicola]|uniref:Uncharacterized protein n=1 Tax=Vermiconidia calcicola TaxID=1690605 RepID=A0ACC3NU89_9PEZI|nr:hypothetical protein LTR37_002950 [Vermiconidia calcicola]
MSNINECMACCDDDKTLIQLCFEHAICGNCLHHMVRLAITDENHYPLTCGGLSCNPIDNIEVDQLLLNGNDDDRQLLHRWWFKLEEYSVPAANRIYCASQECCSARGQSRFINPGVFDGQPAVICPDCDSITCRLCSELIANHEEHVCKGDDHDAAVVAYVETIPEGDRWLWQKCFSCRSWIEKAEACNHITCRCSAQFCLICGREWEQGHASCPHGCPHYAKPTYDEDGFNQLGFHKDTGLDRQGYSADPYGAHEVDGYAMDDRGNEFFDWGYGEYPVYGEDGYDQWGHDGDGFDRDGYNELGFHWDGYDRDGYYEDGYNDEGYNRQGYDRRGLDADAYFDDGYDWAGFDRHGMSMQHLPQAWYDEEGFDPFGVDVWGYTRAGYDYDMRDVDGYDVDGFDVRGFDRDGYDIDGYDKGGLNRSWRDREGYCCRGYDRHHKNRAGELEPGWEIAPSGGIRRVVSDGASAELMDCEHRTRWSYGCSTCSLCEYDSDVFIFVCQDCSARLCRECNTTSPEEHRANARRRHLWPGSDSFGIDGMFERLERSMALAEEMAIPAPVMRRHSICGPCGGYEGKKLGDAEEGDAEEGGAEEGGDREGGAEEQRQPVVYDQQHQPVVYDSGW